MAIGKPSAVQPRESAGKFGSKAKEDGNRLNPSGAFTQPEGKLHSLIDPVTEQPAEAVYQNVEKFEKFRKEVFRVPSKDMDCTIIANAQKEYLRSSDVEAWLTDSQVIFIS